MSLARELAELRDAWERRPLVRALYGEWFELIRDALADADAPTVELGSGIGALKEAIPDVITTDVEPTPWAERVVDAERLPFTDESVGNLVLIDVFHHLPHPARFLDEAQRVLVPGGRIVALEPYVSPVSRLFLRFHPERLDLGADPFGADAAVAGGPMESNQARATLAFFRHAAELERRWPALRVVERRMLGLLVYPLSGGFRQRQLLPPPLARPLRAVERALSFAAPALAFRCFVVLERTDAPRDGPTADAEHRERLGADVDGVPRP